MSRKPVRYIEFSLYGRNGENGVAGPCIGYAYGEPGDTDWAASINSEPNRNCYSCRKRDCIKASAVGKVCIPVYEGETAWQAAERRLRAAIVSEFAHIMGFD